MVNEEDEPAPVDTHTCEENFAEVHLSLEQGGLLLLDDIESGAHYTATTGGKGD